jgi:hypothetical protein
MTARKPAHWNDRKFGAGIVNATALLQAAPASARRLAPVPAYRVELVALISEDAPERGMVTLALMFSLSPPGLEDFMQVFEHELKNVLLDHPECLDALRKAVEDTAHIPAAIALLRNKVSETLRRAANW